MSIWHTSTPTPQDYPLWAFTKDNDTDELDLYRSLEDLIASGSEIVCWCPVSVPATQIVPTPPHVAKAFRQLAESVDTTDWSSSDWYVAGYYHGVSRNPDDTGECGCNQGKCGCS